jgi:hypothetical protein
VGGERKGVCTSPHRFEQEDVSYERFICVESLRF